MLHILITGGWVMLPLAVSSLIAVTIVVDRIRYFRRIHSKEDAEHVIDLVSKGKVVDAMTIAGKKTTPVLRVLKAGLVKIGRTVNPAKSMEAAAIAETAAMKRGLTALDTIITLAPLLGLLGTIIGMIQSFQIMATAGLGQPHAVTGGVAEALVATATGITVAVVALIPYNYFIARIEREEEAIEEYATRLEIALSLSEESE
ncbi:MAG: MotA/TolQ/ExbB proton channel family protein [Geobacteraceae bacterium]|nr:MotA/TolQ/ExbB proton channel family protein [Geobacteraceae bacterium]